MWLGQFDKFTPMIRAFGLVALCYSLLVIAVAFWVVFQSKNQLEASEILSFIMLILHGIFLMVYVGLTRYMLELPLANKISTLDDFIAQDIEVDSRIIKPSGFAMACGIFGFFGLAVMSLGSGVILYGLVRTGGSDMAPMMMAFGILITGIPSFIYIIRTIGLRRVAKEIGSQAEKTDDEEYTFNQFEED